VSPDRPRRLFAAALACVLGLAAQTANASPPRAQGIRSLSVSEDAAYAEVGPSGARVKLSLDPAWQRTAEKLLARSGAPEGAIVASDVRTGRVLVWASRGDKDYVATPFAPSASLFKIVTASALLGSGRASPATRECYAGGDHAIVPSDLEGPGAACTTLGEALGKSINLVFARLAKKHLSASDLTRAAGELGFSGAVPIDVPVGESVVIVPDDPFGLAKAAAGFWNGRLTPLGALFAMQTIANDGERVRLSLLDRGAPFARVSAGRALDSRVAKTLRQMLEVTTRRGTCARAFRRPDGTRALANVGVAAKTGTLVGGRPARMFSWFAGFAPASSPKVAVAVMLANDLTWRTKANVIGRDLLEAYFEPSGAQARRSGSQGRSR
jgi:cell division protein FtsI/penicillin-binding protein 2